MNFIIVVFYFCMTIALFIVLNCIALIAISFVLDNTPVEKKKQIFHPDQLEIGDVSNLLNKKVMRRMFPKLEDRKIEAAVDGFQKMLRTIHSLNITNPGDVVLMLKTLLIICGMLDMVDQYDAIIIRFFPNMNLDELNAFIDNTFANNPPLTKLLTNNCATFLGDLHSPSEKVTSL